LATMLSDFAASSSNTAIVSLIVRTRAGRDSVWGARAIVIIVVSAAINLIKQSTFSEVHLLHLRPTSEHLIHGEQLQFAKLLGILLRHLGRTRAIKIPRQNFLSFF